MGTRADFYVQYMPDDTGRDPLEGPALRWLGSVAMDGYPCGFDDHLFEFVQDSLFQPADEIWAEMVTKMITAHPSGRLAEQGWPWPWPTSATTDYAYVYANHEIWASSFGQRFFKVQPELDCFGEPQDRELMAAGEVDPDRFKKVLGAVPEWPDMTALQGPISYQGMIVISPDGVSTGKD